MLSDRITEDARPKTGLSQVSAKLVRAPALAIGSLMTASLKAVRRGIENEPRDVAIYLMRSMRAEPLMRVGANFESNRYISVSSAVTRVKAKLQKDRKFKDRLEHIESNILKGQT